MKAIAELGFERWFNIYQALYSVGEAAGDRGHIFHSKIKTHETQSQSLLPGIWYIHTHTHTHTHIHIYMENSAWILASAPAIWCHVSLHITKLPKKKKPNTWFWISF